MRSLAFKLTLAFLLVSLVGVALVAVFARRATVTEFDRFVLNQATRDFLAQVSAYYQITGSWAGVVQYVAQHGRPGQQPLPDDGPRPLPPFVLVDTNGRVVMPFETYRVGQHIPDRELTQGIPVKVNQQIVGIILPQGQLQQRDPGEEQYLQRTNQAVLIAALGATGVALVLGLFLAHTLTHPLREMTVATRALAKGELEQTVPIHSQDELGELATAFNQMSADLARANELRRQMTADIAHDLRTPLTVIAGYIESLRDGVLSPSPARLDAMYNEAQHLQRLVEDLRVLSLADAGELPLDLQSMSPRALLERLAASFSHRAEQQNIALIVEAAPELPEMSADPERMVQVLSNLVSNALRYTPAGGTVTLSAQHQAGAVSLGVQDNGEGIPPEEVPRIFDRLYRGDTSRQQQHGESGLGLAIAKSIVELHGGTIAASSTLGQGTTFTITLSLSLEGNQQT